MPCNPGHNGPDLDAAYGLASPDDNRRLYRDWAATYDADFAARSGYRSAGLVARAFVAGGGAGPVLDAGCGTGLVANHLPHDLDIDGIDISAEMLAVARDKERYRRLIEADLTRPLDLPDAAYGGVTSAGTFTHGHVGPAALPELLRVLRPGGLCVLSGNAQFIGESGVRARLSELAGDKTISRPTYKLERIYTAGANPPPGHADDVSYVIRFRRME